MADSVVRQAMRLTFWGWWHLLVGGCRALPPRAVLVRVGLRPQEQPRLGEVWSLCPSCGYVLSKRPETPADMKERGDG